jgi:hypothetical protein
MLRASLMRTEIGCTRIVFLIGNYAVKIPNFRYEWKHFLCGLLSNLNERAFAKMEWPQFCPVVFSFPGGWLLVMRRARQMTREEFDSFDPQAFCEQSDYVVPAEHKPESFGWLNGRVVAIDYGESRM